MYRVENFSSPILARPSPGARPTDGILVEFEIRSGFRVLWFEVCLADRRGTLHMSRQLHCRGVCKILWWSVGYILGRSAADFDRVSNSIEVSLVGRAPGVTQAGIICWL